MSTWPKALSIAGSDSGGGAGIQADLKTFSALGVYGSTAITALTAQNTQEVRDIFPVSPEHLEAQIRAVVEDIGADAIKIGMLGSAPMVRTVARVLADFPGVPVVLDTVMVAKSGARLLETEATEALRQELLPRATLITPNLPEAAVLLSREAIAFAEMPEAAQALAEEGCPRVLLKGGHLPGTEAQDLLYQKGAEPALQTFRYRKTQSRNTHGTGCTLSSAIAADLSKGQSLATAVEQALRYTRRAIEGSSAIRLGSGHGPVHHFWEWWGAGN